MTNVTFTAANVFDALREMESARERFDTIVLDPPAFTKSRATVKSGARGYKEINLRAMRILAPDGVLFTSSCSYHVSPEDLQDAIAKAAKAADKHLQILEMGGQAPDHPVHPAIAETRYLKAYFCRVNDSLK